MVWMINFGLWVITWCVVFISKVFKTLANKHYMPDNNP
jgi:hypothetical protein